MCCRSPDSGRQRGPREEATMQPEPITCRLIVEAVAEYYGLSVVDLLSHRRPQRVSRARQVAMWAAKRLTTRSLTDIGRFVGGRDHATVSHAVRVVDELRERDADFRQQTDDVVLAVEATARTLARFHANGPEDVDPVAVARRILATPRGVPIVSIPEITALASAVSAQELTDSSKMMTGPMKRFRSEPRDRESEFDLYRAVAEVLEADRDLKQAQWTHGERGAQARLDRALKALRENFERETAYVD
ncbi:hypothetical protein HW532_18385 [Kaustia mangrovi]|uniref:Chromosomal replication initiator DnaA C-terminal domain-containing protein n=2 Tax=Kaustia mangrovi TaxID=2593653 RepID=A0A7S8HDC5_9HYPH|nr:hypothetical protein HW532_18385 [Kaustia mangrovi]